MIKTTPIRNTKTNKTRSKKITNKTLLSFMTINIRPKILTSVSLIMFYNLKEVVDQKRRNKNNPFLVSYLRR